jgi:transcriptional regulator with XRE-family HTH domain
MESYHPHDLSELGRLIRQRRKEMGMTQQALAWYAGLTPANLSRLESGRCGVPRLQTLARCAKALHLDLGDLLRAAGFEVAGGTR